jgi:hypothetical protein
VRERGKKRKGKGERGKGKELQQEVEEDQGGRKEATERSQDRE